MRCIVQRVSSASVSVDGRTIGAIDRGLVALVGVAKGDGQTDIEYVASKVRGLRIFDDEHGRMNRSVEEVRGGILVISQFTLLGDARHGRRPAFDDAAEPEVAETAYAAVVERLRMSGLQIETGQFRAHMALAFVNDGPVTILLDSRRAF